MRPKTVGICDTVLRHSRVPGARAVWEFAGNSARLRSPPIRECRDRRTGPAVLSKTLGIQ
jgi:hypothetical protein